MLTDQWMVELARRLGDLNERVVFVGGAVLGLLVDDAGATGVRPTDDLDVLVDVSTRGAYDDLAARLRKRGFRNDTSEDAPLCRWRLGSIVVDVMPISGSILGFTNRWYADAMSFATSVELEPGLSIRMVSGPYFVATKLEAFAARLVFTAVA